MLDAGHLHLLLKPGTVNVVSFLNRWKSWSTRLAWNAGHSGVLWQPSAWHRAIRSETKFLAVLAYISNNPVAAGLADDVEKWPHMWFADDL